MSDWRDERNAKALLRLRRALPEVFPPQVMHHALTRPFIPPTPRRAVESYWRAHPLRADRLARALARASGTPEGWVWRLDEVLPDGRRLSFRTPPAPYRDAAFSRGPGHCCVCGQPLYRFGWHQDLWGDGKPNTRAAWHSSCVIAWQFWRAPVAEAKLLRRAQGRRCSVTGKRLLKTSQVDHREPLFKVWRERRGQPWPDLLAFWGLPNLQVVNREAHAAKSTEEAGFRADHRRRLAAVAAAGLAGPLVPPQGNTKHVAV